MAESSPLPDRNNLSLNQIARQLQGPLFSHVRGRVRSHSDAEDIAQESWARVAGALAGEGIGNIRAYIYSIARNLTVDHYRRQSRNPVVEVDEAFYLNVADLKPNPETQLLTRDELRRMNAIITAMPARPRQIFRLSRIEGMSYADIGRKLGLSRQAVQEHMVRALLALQMAAANDYGPTT
ncbi:RNA polymerase sigma factor [Asticcacaulis endophyticus]|uniref:DNA-directed RNA polymerase sigma-70 factor n=1 Tax=Asticcacaulis endophyticus TaxID=1395890 RepID=A0A918UTA4_9CAUL|nr:RNA polymerase sigma factor [Asticcacaulis endophyticus]GGZ32668.1 DNA-directed RNA polymerase sigma-70 factor [Asticcacaulis endophyticus]